MSLRIHGEPMPRPSSFLSPHVSYEFPAEIFLSVSAGLALRVRYGFTTERLSDVAYDSSSGLSSAGMLLRALGVPASTLSERRLLRRICRLVADRSARLVAMGIAATALYIDPGLKATHVVAADGSLFRLAPGDQAEVERGLREILGNGGANRVQLAYLRDGPGVGAAIIAAVAAG